MDDEFKALVRDEMTRLSDEQLDEIVRLTPGSGPQEIIHAAAIAEIQERASLIYY